MASSRSLHQLSLFGDSMIVIQQVIKLQGNNEQLLRTDLHRIMLATDKCDHIEFFHVKRNLNKEVDVFVN